MSRKTVNLICYANLNNMGDRLNVDMLEALFDVKIKISNVKHGDTVGIGSHLKGLLEPVRQRSLSKQYVVDYIKGIFRKPLLIWGTGFMNYPEVDESNFVFKRKVKVLSLRGQLSKNRVEQILGHKINAPLADGGLLAERWIGKQPKKYTVGIIPHYKEQDSEALEILLNHYKGSTLIDLREDADSVVKKIAECECVLSSSLHGLIVADSYHIPNRHIKLFEYGERMFGDGFKFSDYYSSYGLTDNPITIKSEADIPSKEQIMKEYVVDTDSVERKKTELYKAFKDSISNWHILHYY